MLAITRHTLAGTVPDVAQAVDALFVLYGVGGQMVAGTLITYRHALRGTDPSE